MPLGWSCPTTRFGAFAQSWLPARVDDEVAVVALEVLPARFALDAATKTTAKSASAVSVTPVNQSRRVRRLRNRSAAICLLSLNLDAKRSGAPRVPDPRSHQ